MMQEDLHGAFSLSSLDRRGDEPRRASRRYVATAIVRALDRTAQQNSPLWPLTGWPLTGQVPRRRERNIKLLSAIRQIVAAIWRWRERVRSRQELRELNDHLLEDIGLKRADVGYRLRQPFSPCD
jgi:uncharacterized protein YjiS (DUF1127 family)